MKLKITFIFILGILLSFNLFAKPVNWHARNNPKAYGSWFLQNENLGPRLLTKMTKSEYSELDAKDVKYITEKYGEITVFEDEISFQASLDFSDRLKIRKLEDSIDNALLR